MPRFKKSILPAGEYLITDSEGKRRLKVFDAAYLRGVAKNTMQMINAGLKIPAPFKHHKDAVPVDEEVETDSFNNAGYWQEVKVARVFNEVLGKKVPTLVGIIDAPGDTDNTNTPAGKLQSTVKEVSACIRDKWVDGKGREWGPSMLHGAPVLQPVVPGQEGFSLLDGAVALSASGLASDSPADGSRIGELSKELEESVGIYLDPGTLANDLIRVLLISLKQRKLSDDDPDDKEIVDSQTIYMSHGDSPMPLTQAQAEEVVKLGLINPKTQKPAQLTDFEIKETDPENDPTHQYAMALTGQLLEERKGGLKSRVADLIKTGRTTQEHADATLYPEIDKYELSLGDGAKFKANAIDLLVQSLEALPAKEPQGGADLSNNGLPPGTTVHDGTPPGPGDALPAEQAEAMAKEFLTDMVAS